MDRDDSGRTVVDLHPASRDAFHRYRDDCRRCMRSGTRCSDLHGRQ